MAGLWPPVKGEPYPDFLMMRTDGPLVRLSEFAGKPLLIEPVGLPCAACQAWTGGRTKGGFQGVTPQADLPETDHYLGRHAETSIALGEFTYIQLLLYGMDGQNPPPLEEAVAWEEHFEQRERGIVALVADRRHINSTSHQLIPGFHVVDSDFRLAAWSSNRQDDDSMLRVVFPTLGRLLRDS